MNQLTGSDTSIVDPTPGTTADVKTTLMEFHNLGPVRLFDTAGLDEGGFLGSKKREKTLSTVKRCDLVIVVVDPLSTDWTVEREVLALAAEQGKHAVVVVNVFASTPSPGFPSAPLLLRLDVAALEATARENLVSFAPDGTEFLVHDLSVPREGHRVIAELERRFPSFSALATACPASELLPPSIVRPGTTVLLNVPMDAETPSGRLLRPQAMAQEYCLSHWANTYVYRMDLASARSPHASVRSAEQRRFLDTVRLLDGDWGNLSLVVTDSQAMDVVFPLMSKGLAAVADAAGVDGVREAEKVSHLPLTTFSVMMSHYLSGGRLSRFSDDLAALATLRPGAKVLIAEACNHDRLTEQCEDIGMVQLPNALRHYCAERLGFPGEELVIEHAFGRSFPTHGLQQYHLVVHCGGCFLDAQTFQARMRDLDDAGVPVVNYGTLLSHLRGPAALKRVMAPFIQS
jgi:hypothetical protein